MARQWMSTVVMALILALGIGVMVQAADIPQELVDAACAEGTIVFYSGMGLDITMNYVEAFRDAYPCLRTEVVRQTSHQIHQRFLTEQRAGQHLTDVIMHVNAGIFFGELVRGGYIMEYDHGSDQHYPESLKVSNYAYPLFMYLSGPMYNVFLVTPEEKALLETWEGITDPVWRGRAAVSVPSAGGSSYSPNYMFLRTHREQFGPEYIAKLAAQEPQLYTSTIPAHQNVVSGEVHVFFWGNSPNVGNFIAQGAPVAMTFPSPTPAIPAVAGIAATAPHPNAAKLFMRWAFSEPGQRAALEAFSSAVAYEPLKDEPPPAFAQMEGGWKAPEELLVVDWDDFDQYLETVIQEWNEIFGYSE